MARRTGSATAERSTRRNREEDEEPTKSSTRARRSRDDEEDEPKRERGTSTAMGKGWAGAEKNKATARKNSDFHNNWVLPTKRTLVKLLDAEPFVTFAEHWPKGITKGKRSFVCLGDDCPLCDAGERASGYGMFNIADLSNPDEPVVETWKASQTMLNTLMEYDEEERTSPLNRSDLYFVIWKSETGTGRSKKTTTNINPVKARDLEEDYKATPLTEDEIEDLMAEGFDESVVYVTSKADLQKVAAELED